MVNLNLNTMAHWFFGKLKYYSYHKIVCIYLLSRNIFTQARLYSQKQGSFHFIRTRASVRTKISNFT